MNEVRRLEVSSPQPDNGGRLKQTKKVRPVERMALAADHLLYGFILSETRRRPQE
ncbi:MAG: hypothetical protein ACR2ML_10545 [Solirubrobacteraceae bacterium]